MTTRTTDPSTASNGTNVSLNCLPPELWAEIASHLGPQLRQDVRLLALCKKWHAVAYPVFARHVNVTDMTLWKHMDSGERQRKLIQALRKMEPFIRSLKIEQTIRDHDHLYALLDPNGSPIHTRADPEDQKAWQAFIGQYVSASELDSPRCTPATKLMCRGPETLAAVLSLKERLRVFSEITSTWRNTSTVDINMDWLPALPYLDDTPWSLRDEDAEEQPEQWYFGYKIEALFQLEHLTSLRLRLGASFENLHLCELVKDKLPYLESLFVSMDSMCPKILPSQPFDKPLRLRDLTIILFRSDLRLGQVRDDAENVIPCEEYGCPSPHHAHPYPRAEQADCIRQRIISLKPLTANPWRLRVAWVMPIRWIKSSDYVTTRLKTCIRVFDAVSGDYREIRQNEDGDRAQEEREVIDLMDDLHSLPYGHLRGNRQTSKDHTMNGIGNKKIEDSMEKTTPATLEQEEARERS